MTQALAEAALETALNAMSPALATAWRNTPFTPTAGTPYQRVAFLYADPDNPVFGAGHQERGYMQIDLMYPMGAGPATAAARAELLRTTFARGSSFTASGTTPIIERTPSISDGVIEGDRWKVTVKIRFYVNQF